METTAKYCLVEISHAKVHSVLKPSLRNILLVLKTLPYHFQFSILYEYPNKDTDDIITSKSSVIFSYVIFKTVSLKLKQWQFVKLKR